TGPHCERDQRGLRHEHAEHFLSSRFAEARTVGLRPQKRPVRYLLARNHRAGRIARLAFGTNQKKERKTKMKNTLAWLEAALVMAPFIALVVFWNQIPERVPMHWNIRGE